MHFPKTTKIKKALLAKRAEAIENAYDDDPEVVHLTPAEYKYLSSLIAAQNVAEEDVELALALITEDEAHAEQLAQLVFEQYPHLIKNLYGHLASSAYEGSALWQLVQALIADRNAHEYSLFWCVRIVLHLYDWDKKSAKALIALYDHPNSSDVVRAAILECEHIDFGLVDRKESVLRNAGGSLLAVSAAVGLRNMEKGRRNQLYKYAAASSPLLYQITRAMQLPPSKRELQTTQKRSQ